MKIRNPFKDYKGRWKDDATTTEKTVWTLFLVYFGYALGPAVFTLFEYIFQNYEKTFTKKWSGIGKEMFTSADNYILEIKDAVDKADPLRLLIFAAIICIDMVFKE